MNELFSPAGLASQVLLETGSHEEKWETLNRNLFWFFEFKSILLKFVSHGCFVGSMDRESSQQLQMWFSEHFFAPKLGA